MQSALINLGGNVVVLGSKPDGSPFTIGMQKPFDEQGKAIALFPFQTVP
ncbi:MAG: FAD:protein FMN transferase [Eisenbergiella sp.]